MCVIKDFGKLKLLISIYCSGFLCIPYSKNFDKILFAKSLIVKSILPNFYTPNFLATYTVRVQFYICTMYNVFMIFSLSLVIIIIRYIH